MLELFLDLLTTRVEYNTAPCGTLSTLALAFDQKNDWNHKSEDYARPPETTRDQCDWLCDLINQFCDKKGFQLIKEKFAKADNLTASTMSELLQPLTNCAELLVGETTRQYLSSCMERAFKYAENLGEAELKSQDIHAAKNCIGSDTILEWMLPNKVLSMACLLYTSPSPRD